MEAILVNLDQKVDNLEPRVDKLDARMFKLFLRVIGIQITTLVNSRPAGLRWSRN